MDENTAASKELKIKFFFGDAPAEGTPSPQNAVNKWLRQTRNIQVYDIVHKRRVTASGDEGIPYIGVVYCHRRKTGNARQ